MLRTPQVASHLQPFVRRAALYAAAEVRAAPIDRDPRRWELVRAVPSTLHVCRIGTRHSFAGKA